MGKCEGKENVVLASVIFCEEIFLSLSFLREILAPSGALMWKLEMIKRRIDTSDRVGNELYPKIYNIVHATKFTKILRFLYPTTFLVGMG